MCCDSHGRAKVLPSRRIRSGICSAAADICRHLRRPRSGTVRQTRTPWQRRPSFRNSTPACTKALFLRVTAIEIPISLDVTWNDQNAHSKWIFGQNNKSVIAIILSYSLKFYAETGRTQAQTATAQTTARGMAGNLALARVGSQPPPIPPIRFRSWRRPTQPWRAGGRAPIAISPLSSTLLRFFVAKYHQVRLMCCRRLWLGKNANTKFQKL